MSMSTALIELPPITAANNPLDDKKNVTVNSQHIVEIDGIRGWAALAIVVFHLTQQTFGNIHLTSFDPRLWPFIDAPMAVSVFFILSGDALSTAYVSTQKINALNKMAARRYFRLTIPILMSCFVTYLLMKAGLTFNMQAGLIVHNKLWLGAFLTFKANIISMLNFALKGVYGWAESPDNYNTFLWTMPVELIGSFLVFCYLYLMNRLRFPQITVGLLAVMGILLSQFYGLFFIGVLLAQMRARGTLNKIRQSIYGRIGGPLILGIAYLAEYFYYSYPLPSVDRTDMLGHMEVYLYDHEKIIIAVGIICGVYISNGALLFFQTRLSRFLGRISFGMYLLQFPILCSFLSYLICYYPDRVGSIRFSMMLSTISIALTIASADVFSRLEGAILKSIGYRIDRLFVEDE